jgi:hypothetical protein
MSEKEKGKFHPFAGYLQSDEVLLWAYCDKPESLIWQNGQVRVPRERDGCIAAFFKRLGLPYSSPRRPIIRAYGVTNRRLLMRQNNAVRGKSLKKFQVVTQLIDHDYYATLNLGRSSWWWNGIPRDEAQTALQIIEQAKKHA